MTNFDYDAVFRRILSKNRWGSEASLAKALGVTANTWTAYKKGKSSFGLHEVTKICDILDVVPRWLLFGETAAGKPSLYDQVENLVIEAHAANSIKLPSAGLAAAAAQYLDALERDLLSPEDEEEIELRLRLLQKRIQKDIEQARAEPGTGKLSA